MWIYTKRFDEDKNMVTLNSGYIFSYSTYDGFCERLLAAELLVDHDFIFFDTTDRGSQQFLLNLD